VRTADDGKVKYNELAKLLSMEDKTALYSPYFDLRTKVHTMVSRDYLSLERIGTTSVTSDFVWRAAQSERTDPVAVYEGNRGVVAAWAREGKGQCAR